MNRYSNYWSISMCTVHKVTTIYVCVHFVIQFFFSLSHFFLCILSLTMVKSAIDPCGARVCLCILRVIYVHVVCFVCAFLK